MRIMFLLLREGKERDQWLPKPRDGGKQQEKGQPIPNPHAERQGLAQCLNGSSLKTVGPFAGMFLVFERRRYAQMVA